MIDAKTKEEIVREQYEKYFQSQKYYNSVNRQMNQNYFFPAMDEYAKQKSIQFATWYANSRWIGNLTYDATGKLEKQKSMEEVYELFEKEHINSL